MIHELTQIGASKESKITNQQLEDAKVYVTSH